MSVYSTLETEECQSCPAVDDSADDTLAYCVKALDNPPWKD